MTEGHLGDLLSALLDGELTAAATAAEHAHLEGCPECAHELTLASEARQLVRSLPPVEPPAAFYPSVLAGRRRPFDTALAQLVVHFMADPVRGLREMARVTRKHGVVAACVWDHAGGQGPLSVFWEAALELDRDVEDESQLAGAREGHLAQLFREAGLHGVEERVLSIDVEHPSFEEWWEPFTLGVGPAGDYAAGLEARRQAQLRERCRELLPAAPFVLTARAWAARGLV